MAASDNVAADGTGFNIREWIIKMSDVETSNCIIYDEDKQGGLHIAGVDPLKIADMFMSKCAFVYIDENKLIYMYNDITGCYDPNMQKDIERFVYYRFNGLYDYRDHHPVINKSVISEVVAKIKAVTKKSASIFQDRTHPYFNVSNGIIDLEDGALLDHSPDLYMLISSPVTFDITAECPKFLAWLKKQLDEEYHDAAQEMFGFCLWNKYTLQRAFMLLGAPRTGKGTFIRILQGVLGDASYSNVSLHDMLSDKYLTSELYGKIANLSGDMLSTPIRNHQIFQNCTGEDKVTVQFKYGRGFKMSNIAKLIYAANALPRLMYDDDAFYTRWAILPFDHSYISKEDPKIEQELLTELPGVLNWALEGLHRLIENNWQLSHHIKGLDVYAKKSKPEIAFLEEVCEPSDDGYIFKNELLLKYNEWAKENNIAPAQSKKVFGSLIIDQTIIPVGEPRPFNPKTKNQQEAWSGIKYKTT